MLAALELVQFAVAEQAGSAHHLIDEGGLAVVTVRNDGDARRSVRFLRLPLDIVLSVSLAFSETQPAAVSGERGYRRPAGRRSRRPCGFTVSSCTIKKWGKSRARRRETIGNRTNPGATMHGRGVKQAVRGMIVLLLAGASGCGDARPQLPAAEPEAEAGDLFNPDAAGVRSQAASSVEGDSPSVPPLVERPGLMSAGFDKEQTHWPNPNAPTSMG